VKETFSPQRREERREVLKLSELCASAVGIKIFARNFETVLQGVGMSENNQKPVYRIADLHESDRPRERLSALGAQALTNAELIAILLRVGVKGENAVEVGQRLLNKLGGISGLHRASMKEL